MRRLRFSEAVAEVAVSPDGRLLAAQRQADGHPDARVEVRDLASDRPLYTRALPFGTGDLSFSPDGRVLVASTYGARGSAVVGWDARSGEALFTGPASQQAVPVALAPDSRALAVGTGDGRVLITDTRNGKQSGPPMKVARAAVDNLAFSPDGRLLALTSGVTTTLWDFHARQRVGDTFPISPGTIPVVNFESNGRLITELGDAIEWPIDRGSLQRFACRVAGRDLTRGEWKNLVPNRPYRHVCP